MNRLNESLSMNVFQVWGMAFMYTWQPETRHTGGKWCQDLLTWWNCLDVKI
jgi:hypothetical protein